MKNLFLLSVLCCSASLQSQIRNNEVYEITDMDQSTVREEIRIPDFNGLQTLKCDFHIHTVFSDGKVWPDQRIYEAWQQGLDAIAITDHIEYRPNKGILQGDHNTSYNIAKDAANNIGFIAIKGAEITRQKPLGHINALFIQDANPLDVSDPLAAIDEARRQGAFIMWNHPGWPDDKSTFYPVHKQLISEKKINGIEIFNYMEYYPVSFDWCNENNLAFMANSDIHAITTGDYGKEKAARPITLVFAKEKSEKGIREALFDGRSAALFNGQLAGRAEHLRGLIKASLKIRILYDNNVEVTNISDIPYQATINNELLLFPANKTVRVKIPAGGQFTVENCFVGANNKLVMSIQDFN